MPTNTPDLLEKIRAKVVEAVPEIEKTNQVPCPFERSSEHAEYCKNERHLEKSARPIRLADVLLAIENSREELVEVFTMYPNGMMAWERQDDSFFPKEQRSQKWNLRKDSLEDQSPECIAFISSILGVV